MTNRAIELAKECGFTEKQWQAMFREVGPYGITEPRNQTQAFYEAAKHDGMIEKDRELAALREQLAECQAREVKYRSVLSTTGFHLRRKDFQHAHASSLNGQAADAHERVLNMQQDRSALDAMLAHSIDSEDTNPWKAALTDAGVVNWSLTEQNKNDPLKLLADIIQYNVQIALDPQVSSDAAKLVAQARHDALMEAASMFHEPGLCTLLAVYGELRRMAEEQLKP